MTTVAKLTIEMAADVARIKRDMAQANQTVQRSTKQMRDAAVLATKALGAIGAALSVTAIARASSEFGRFARELEKFSTLTGVGTEKFQELTFAAKTFGIEQEKLADILKDTQDKVGDFLATGAGGMADFFENIAPLVGVTAENFRNLNGADALQLYISSLEKANLSQAEMVFYMEAIASDSTALIPLFTKNGQAVKKFADEAENLGLVLDGEAIEKAKVLDSQMVTLNATLESTTRELLQKLAPAMISVAESVRVLVVEIPRLAEQFKPFLQGGAVAIGLLALPKMITAVSVAVTTRLLPALVALGPYAAAFVALGAAFSGVMTLLQDSKREFESIAEAETTIAGLEKQLANAQQFAEKGSLVAQKRVERIKRELTEAKAAYEVLKGAVESAGASIETTTNRLLKNNTAIIKNTKEREKAQKALTKATEQQLKIEDEALSQQIDIIQAEMNSTEEIKRQTKEIVEQTKMIGSSERELQNLVLAKIDDQIETKKQQIEMISFGDANDELIAQYRQQIEALKDLRQARIDMYDRQQAQRVIEENKRVASTIETNIVRAFEDAFMRGGDLASSLRRAIEAEFSRMIIQPVIGNVTSSIFGGGASGGFISGGGFGGGLGGIQSVGSLFNAFGGGLVSSVSSAIAGAGTMFGSSALGAFATGMKGSTLAAGLMGPTTAGAGGALGLGATFGAALPWVGGALAIGSLLGGFGSNKISAKELSSTFTGAQSAGMGQRFSTILSALGGTGAATFGFTGNTGRQSQNPNFDVSAFVGGRRLFSGYDTRAGVTGDNGTFLAGEIPLNEENLTLFTTRAVVAALQESTFVRNISELFDSVNVKTASIEELNAALAETAGLRQLNLLLQRLPGRFREISTASLDTTRAFLNTVGGMEKLARSMAFYNDQFRTDAEKFSDLTRSVGTAMRRVGGSLFDTRQEFINFFEALDPMSAGQLTNFLGQIDAYYDEIERREREAYDATLRSIEQIRTAGQGIADYLRQLGITEQTQSPQQRLQAAASEFNRLIGLSRVGDVEALGSVTGASSQFLDAARSYFGSSAEFKNIFDRVRSELQSLPGVEEVPQFARNVEQSNTDLLNELKAMRQDLVDSGSLNLKVVTMDGKVVMESTIDQIRERSRRGELVVYASGVK